VPPRLANVVPRRHAPEMGLPGDACVFMSSQAPHETRHMAPPVTQRLGVAGSTSFDDLVVYPRQPTRACHVCTLTLPPHRAMATGALTTLTPSQVSHGPPVHLPTPPPHPLRWQQASGGSGWALAESVWELQQRAFWPLGPLMEPLRCVTRMGPRHHAHGVQPAHHPWPGKPRWGA
jgi:hypothetical protein